MKYCILSSGKNLAGNNSLYKQTQQQVQFRNKIIAVIFAVPLLYFFPFVIVAYDWCIGRYSIDSWTLVFPIW